MGRETISRRAELFDLIRQRSFGRAKVKLASGRDSDFYFDMKPTMLHPAGAAAIADLLLDAIDGVAVDYIGGLEMGAVPLASMVVAASKARGRGIAGFFVRKRPKEHGAQKLVEGLMKTESLSGKRVVIVEDVTTTGGSALQAADAVRAEGGEVVLVVSLVDRLEGAVDAFASARLPFRALFTAEEFLQA